MQLVPIELNSQTVSGITGSVSIACWVIVFVPQIYENLYRKSTEGLSLLFVVLWLAGDVFNLLGAMMQHLLPTMIILAAYYTLADVVLLVQCLWYGTEEKLDPIHLSPANPSNESVLHDVFNECEPLLHRDANHYSANTAHETTAETRDAQGDAKSPFSDGLIISTVILAGFISWYISYCHNPQLNQPPDHHPHVEMNWLAQFYGYLSAILYLGSRIPQLLLNFKRKSCEGVAFLFFVFACLGNITYIVSVLAISLDSSYLLLNASWLAGSSGTLIMDFIIFIQFFVYGRKPISSS